MSASELETLKRVWNSYGPLLDNDLLVSVSVSLGCYNLPDFNLVLLLFSVSFIMSCPLCV